MTSPALFLLSRNTRAWAGGDRCSQLFAASSAAYSASTCDLWLVNRVIRGFLLAEAGSQFCKVWEDSQAACLWQVVTPETHTLVTPCSTRHQAPEVSARGLGSWVASVASSKHAAHDANIVISPLCWIAAFMQRAPCVELGFARAYSKRLPVLCPIWPRPFCKILVKWDFWTRRRFTVYTGPRAWSCIFPIFKIPKYFIFEHWMDKSKKIYIFIAEISNMLNMGQDTKTPSDNGTDGCSDESHKLRRRHLPGIISFLFRARLRGPVTDTTRAETQNKISQIFTFNPVSKCSALPY